MKNKLVYIFLLILLIFNFSCKNQKSKQLAKILIIGTGSSSGTYFPLGSAFANLFSIKIDNTNAIAVVTNGSIDNIKLLKNDEINLGLCQSDIAYYASKGINIYKDNPFKELKGIISLYPEIFQIIVHKNSNINTIYDLKGKKIVVGNKNSGTYINSFQILNEYNITEKDIIPYYTTFKQGSTAFKNGQVDAMIITAGVPTFAIKDIIKYTDIRILNFDEKMIDKICKKYKFFSKEIIKKGTYNNINQDIKTIGLKALLVCKANMDKKVIYNILNAIFKNKDYLINMHKRAKDININTITTGMEKNFIHKGTIDFLKSYKHIDNTKAMR